MKFDKGELFISVVWILTICFICRVMYVNVELQSEIGGLNREIHKLHEEYCPLVNYNSDACKEFKETESFLKEIEKELQEELNEESRHKFIDEQLF